MLPIILCSAGRTMIFLIEDDEREGEEALEKNDLITFDANNGSGSYGDNWAKGLSEFENMHFSVGSISANIQISNGVKVYVSWIFPLCVTAFCC